MTESESNKTASRLYDLLTQYDDKDKKKAEIEKLCGSERRKYYLTIPEAGILKIEVMIFKDKDLIVKEESAFPFMSLEYGEIIKTIKDFINAADNMYENQK